MLFLKHSSFLSNYLINKTVSKQVLLKASFQDHPKGAYIHALFSLPNSSLTNATQAYGLGMCKAR